MRVIVCYQLRDDWMLHCLLEDARTPISPIVHVKDEPTVYKLLRYVGATDEEVDLVAEDIRRWSRGSTHITLAGDRKNLLRVREPWAGELGLH